MCLLAVLWRVVEDAPLIVAANREEAYDRPGTPPQLVNDPVRFVAGLDSRAGGTWLGVNRHGLLIAVTNGPKSEIPPDPRSRGLLTREMLQCRTAAEAAQLAAKELATKRYAGCNFLCASTESLYVVHGSDWLRVLPLPPGRYVQTHGNVNNTTDRRIAQALAFLHERPMPTSAECVSGLTALCAQPGICLHGEKGGTVSSSIFVLRPKLGESHYWHAQGPPDRQPYQDYSQLLQELR
jgi:uncharacterized protein with NRDE domain